MMKKEFKLLYGVLAVMILAITTIGATYAYWVASAQSASNTLQTESTIYSISMNITPLYDGFSVIPMDDDDALKALKKQCKDKYNRGACFAYNIYVYDYNVDLEYISGVMDITTNNMQNLSYMMLQLSDTYDETSCVTLAGTNENYCIVKEATSIGDGVGLSLGDSYDVSNVTSVKFILLLWLSNLEYSQNEVDIGSFEATVTMQAGNGGQIKGSIFNSIKLGDEENKDEETAGDGE